ncbi:MAG TPA: glycosyl hydrolase [Actinomycetota bacterium]
MRARIAGLSLTVVGIAGLLVAGSLRSPQAPVARTPAALETEENPAEPDEWMLLQRSTQDDIPANAFERAVKQMKAVAAETAETDPEVAEKEWELVGPSNIGGRLVDVAVDPTLADTVYAAAATGGVWKSTDAGSTFAPIWPSDLTQSMGALAISSNGTLFAGTGEANNGGGSIVYGGTGIYRSKDRGVTWEHVGLPDSGAIGRIAVDPTNPNRIFVASRGDLFRPGGDRGLYRSLDGGDTWTKVLAGANEITGAVDVAIDPVNPQNVYAAMWETIRMPELRVYGGMGSGLYRSQDGGATWTRLENGLPAASQAIGRIGVAVAPSTPNRLYAIVIETDGDFLGFYISLDFGSTWTVIPTATSTSMSQSTFGWWFGRVWVDPVNPNHVWVAGVSLVSSLNAGLVWASAPGVHADQHAMAWDPKVTGRVYLGNDGGFYRSDTNGLGTWTKATYEPYTQFYSVDVSQQDPSRYTGGTQDNGCLRSFDGAAMNSFGCGDGLQTLINYNNHTIYYGCSQYGSCNKQGGGSFGSTTSNRRGWFTPVEFDPNDPNIMYYAGNRLNRTTQGGGTWTAISPDLTGGPPPDLRYPNYGTIQTIAPAKTDGNRIYVGTDDGRIWSTPDLGQTWIRAEDPTLPERWVTRIAVDPADEDLAYATFSGFRSGSDTAHVFRTRDGAATWEDISGNLPNAPVNDVVILGGALVVATDVGVYVSRDAEEDEEGRHWLKVGDDPPLAPITDMRVHAATNTLYAASFGRGIYRVELEGLEG